MSFIEDKPIRDGLGPKDLIRMNVGRRWWFCKFDLIPDGLEYKEVLRRYLAKIADHIRNGRGLLLRGPLSSGKSGAASIIAKAVVMHGGTALFVPVSELADHKIENRIFDASEDLTVWDRMQDVDLLVLDDIGAEHSSAWAKSLVERIVRLRSNTRRAIIYTANTSKMTIPLKDLYGETLMAIIKASALPVLVDGKNWRDEEENDLEKEIMGE